VRRDKGKPADALASYRAALAIRDRLGAKEFGNPRWRRDLSASHRKVGEVLANQGDLSGALAAYGEALKIIDTLATGKPDDPDLLHQRCVTHERLGDVKCMAGDPKGALAAYRDAQEVAESLVARDPNDPHWHRDLFTVYHRLGNVLRRARDFSGALKAYRNALATAERLATQDAGPAESVAGCPDGASVAPEAPLEKDIAPSATPPAVPSTDRVFAEMTNDADWQRNVSVAHQLIGDVLRDQKDFAGALSEYRADLAIAARLAATAPANKRWQHDLSVSHERIGDLLRKQEDFAGAADAYQAALAIRDDLARKDPSNAEWRRDFALSCGRMVTALLPQSTRRPGEIQRWLTRGFDSLASISREATSPEQEKVYAYLEDLRGKAAKARAAGADQPGGIILPTPTSSATPT
jgi:tetratricopeptide (TPR) repeat protein